MTMARFFGIALLALTASCTLPSNSQPQPQPRATGTVTFSFAGPSRTVAVDWATLVKKYTVTLTKTDSTVVSDSTTFPNQTSLTLSGITVGEWTILVEGKDEDGITVAQATDTRNLSLAETIAVKVLPLEGNGGFSFKLRFPQPVSGPDQITTVQGKLYTLAGDELPTYSFAFATPFSTEEEETYQAVTFTGSGLAKGSYRLGISLQRSGGVARYLSEAINIGGSVTADRWIAPNGAAFASRDLTLADFTSTNTALADLVLSSPTGPGLFIAPEGTTAYAFSDSVRDYSLKASSIDASQSLTFKPKIAMDGQSIEYSLDGAAWSNHLSNTEGTVNITAGPSQVLKIRVTAADGTTQGIYNITVTKAVLASTLSLAVGSGFGGTTMGTNEAKPIDVTFGNAPTNEGVSFASSDPSIATVVWDSGTARYWIYAYKVGVVTITATSLDQGRASTTLDFTLVPGYFRMETLDRGSWAEEASVQANTITLTGNATSLYALTEAGALYQYQNGVWKPFMTLPATYQYLGVAPDGTLYAGDPDADAVYQFTGTWERLPGTIDSLSGLAIAGDGQLYIADGTSLKARSQGLWVTRGSLPANFRTLGGGDTIQAVANATLSTWDTTRWVTPLTLPADTVATTVWRGALKALRVY